MAEAEISYEVVLDQLNDGVCLVGRDHRVIYWNKGAERITGFPKEEIIGRPCSDGFLGHWDEKGNPAFPGGLAPALVCLQDQEARECELLIEHHTGGRVPVLLRVSPVLNPLGETIGALQIFSDNTSKVAARQRIAELEELALICPLTGVGNRRYSELALKNAFEEFKRYEWPFGLCFVDLDRFKDINDLHGHAAGDEVLRMSAHALRGGLRSFDFVGRWGGEEFIVLLPNIAPEVLRKVAERCRAMIEASSCQIDGKQIQVTASIGVSVAQPDDTPERLMARVDQLLYASKKAGRNTITFEG